MDDGKIRLKFDEESMQDMYIGSKISFAKLVEFAYLLGSLGTVFAKKEELTKEYVESATSTARHLVVNILQALPESASDAEIEDFVLSENVITHLTHHKLLSMLDNLIFNVIKAAADGKAYATTIEGDVVDLIFSEQGSSPEEIEKLLDMVDDAPIKKLDA